jgi:alkylhydroperoxidase family enzyme
MASMREIKWETPLLELKRSPAFERRFRRETGRPANLASYFAGIPWVEDAAVDFNVNAGKLVVLDPQLAGLIGMIVSQDNSCRFCFAETRAFLRILGMPESRISKLEQDLLTEEFNAQERAALDFARHFSRSNPAPTASDVDKLRDSGFDDLQIIEIASVASIYVFFNRVTTFFALPPHEIEALPDRWFVRMLRPLIAYLLTRSGNTAPREALSVSDREGIFSRVVVGFDGLPMARSLRRAIDGMWRSEVLTRRTKGLVIAVIARALACADTEKEATDLLYDEGLSGEQVGEALAHLTSPMLDPTERLMLSFARETVWYEPARVQPQRRELMTTLSREEFVELVAVASLANVICRLGAAASASG